MTGGDIVFSTSIDSKGAEAQLKSLQKEIESAMKASAKAADAKLPIEQQLDALRPKLEEARAQLEQFREEFANVQKLAMVDRGEDSERARADLPRYRKALEAQEQYVAKLEADWDKLSNKAAEYDATIERCNGSIAENEARAGQLQRQLSGSGESFSGLLEGAKKLEKRLIGLAKRVFIFSMFTKMLRGVRAQMSKILNTSEEYRNQVAKLKGALATAFAPIANAALPLVIKLLKFLTQVASVVAYVISTLFGRSVAQSVADAKALDEEAKAIDGVGEAAKGASKNLASFDEINNINSDSGGGGIGIDYSDVEMIDEIDDRIKNIAVLVTEIGLAFLGWKIAEGILANFGTLLQYLGGIALIAYGINGIMETISDILENGLNTENLEKLITYILIIGTGLSILTGSIFPLIIAGIASILLWLADLTGHGEELLQGFIDFFSAVFVGDWEKAGEALKKIWDAVWATIKDTAAIVIGWFTDKIAAVIDWFKEKWNAFKGFSGGGGGSTNGGGDAPTGRMAIPQTSIPMLASGAVIPPNAPFMAMLGDQRNGTNIEAPENLLRQVVREEGGNSDALLRELISVVRGIHVGDEVIGRAATRYQKQNARQGGNVW